MKPLRVNLEDLPNNTKTPILTYCRKLIKEGFSPKSKLHVFRENHTFPDIIVNNIEDASKLSILETPRLGPVFVKFQSWDPSSLQSKNNKLEGDV